MRSSGSTRSMIRPAAAASHIAAAGMGVILLVLLHIHCRELAALQTQSDPVLLLLVQGQNGLAHQSAGEDAALLQSFLQAGMSLTGGLAAAVDGLRDVVDAVRPILCFLQSVLVRILEDIPCRIRAPSMPGNQETHRVSSWQVIRLISGHS